MALWESRGVRRLGAARALDLGPDAREHGIDPGELSEWDLADDAPERV